MQAEQYKLPNATLIFDKDFFAGTAADEYFHLLKSEINWQVKEIKLFGKMIKQPRLVAFYGDDNVTYKYSGMVNTAMPWTTTLLAIKQKVKTEFDLDFNSCLANLYRTGNDSMGWHQDNEKVLGQNPTICSVTFGAKRPFQLKHITDKNQRLEIELNAGSLLIMAGSTQHFYKHQIPKTKKIIGERLNLTFRNILS